MTNVGVVKVAFDGDTGKAEGAFARFGKGIDTTGARLEKLAGKLGNATPYADKLAGRLERVGDAAAKMGTKAEGGAAELGGALDRLKRKADAIDNSAGKLQTAIGGIGSAFGVAGQKVGDLVGGVADVAMAFAMGGPLLAGLALVGVGVAGVAEHFSAMEEAATKAADESADRIRALREEVSSLGRDLRAMEAGVSTRRLGAAEDFQSILGEANAAFAAVGGRERFERAKEYSPDQRRLLMSDEAFAKASEMATRLDLAAERLATIVKMEQKAKQDAIDNARIDAAVDVANAREAKFGKPVTRLVETPYSAASASAFEAALMQGHAGPAQMATVSATALEAELSPETIVISGVDNATGDFIDKMNADFMAAGDAVLDLRDPLERFSDGLRASLPGVDGLVAALAGGGFGAAGAAIGGAVGAAVGAAFGDVSGSIGGAIGSLLGGILGDSLDALIQSLGVLRPLFDGVAVIIGALQPILLVVKVLMGALGEVLAMTAPLVLAVAKPVAALVLVLVRVVELLVPFAGVLVGAVAGLVQFLDLITVGIGWLDAYFFRPLIEGARKLYNSFVDIVNTVTDWGRQIFGEDFGVKMDKIGTFVGDVIKDFGATMDEGTDKIANAFDDSQQNLPSGYRIPFYESEVPDGPGAGAAAPTAQTSIGAIYNLTLSGPVTVSASSPEGLTAALQRESMRSRGRPFAWPSMASPPKKN